LVFTQRFLEGYRDRSEPALQIKNPVSKELASTSVDGVQSTAAAVFHADPKVHAFQEAAHESRNVRVLAGLEDFHFQQRFPELVLL
jgi:hypothetical protein